MKAVLAFMILLASPLGAQPGGNCKVIDCPSNFLPTPSLRSPDARKNVAKALVAVNVAEDAERLAAANLKGREKEIVDRLAGSIPWYKPWQVITEDDLRIATISDPDYLRLMVHHQSAVAENYKARNDAILEAVKAYQLTPPVLDFKGDPRAAGVNMVAKPWLPRYSRHERRDEKTGLWRKRTDEELKQEELANTIVGGGVMVARTRGDGVMEFYGQAFTSPEELALAIYHESSHWVDIAGKSGGFQRSDPPAVSFRTEQRAYERSAAFASQIGANAQKHLDQAEQFKLQAEISEREKLTKAQILGNPRFRHWIGKHWEGSLAIGPALPELTPGDEDLLKTKMAEAHRLVQKDREHRELMAEMKRRSDNARPSDLRPTRPEDGPPGYIPAVPYAPGKDGIAALNPKIDSTAPLLFREIASRACASPPKSFDRELRAVNWEHFRREMSVASYAEGLIGCERRVVLRLIELGRAPGVRIDAASVRAAVAEPANGASPGGGIAPPTQNHDPVWGKIGPIIGR